MITAECNRCHLDVIKNKVADRTYELKGIVEKPKPEEATSDLASLGKWIFNSKIFKMIENTPNSRILIELSGCV